MRIVHLSTYDIRGGAALATYRLHTALRRLGHESLLLVEHRYGDDPTVLAFRPPIDVVSRARRRLRRARIRRALAAYRTSRPATSELFTDDRSPHGAGVPAWLPPADVVTLHWVAGFVDYGTFLSRVPARTPVVWRLADMHAFTGGCHYDFGCGRFAEGCGQCPQLGSTRPRDLSSASWRRKQAALRSCRTDRLHFVAPSRWMATELGKSPLLAPFPVTVIPAAVDTTQFAPRDRALARDLASIPQTARVVLFAADGVANPRKGFAVLLAALGQLASTPELTVLSVGGGTPPTAATLPVLHLGPVPHRWLSLVYSAADVFVAPALQDNSPNTVLEAMACGTPVVAFDTGGIPELVRHDLTGLLVPATDVTALATAIRQLLENPSRGREMGTASRRIVLEEHSMDRQATRYSDLYASLP